jgi:threonine dehydratase
VIALEDVHAARETLGGDLHRTPILRSSRLGERLGVDLRLKAELFQKTGSFKPRGALNRLRNTPAADLERGLITVSAGNHAQGLAWAAGRLGAPCVVVMPEGASASKIEAARGYGAEVLIGGPMTQVFERMQEIREERGLTLIHPFDDPLVIAGQGTVGLEIAEQVPEVDLVVVPVGGGGLISGIATAVKALRPEVRVVGVEPEGAAALRAAWDAGHVVHLSDLSTFADGLAAPMAGELTLEITREWVDDLVVVTEEEIFAGLEAVMTQTKLYAEGAGAASTAALLAEKVGVRPGEVVVSVVSGGNLDFDRLRGLGT